MTRSRRFATVRAAAIAALTASGASAQHAPPGAWAVPVEASAALGAMTPAWLQSWSPLRPLAEASRTALGAPHGLGVLESPPPAGAFALAGAPGSMARDFRRDSVPTRYGELTVRTASDEGEFRRPLDFAESRVSQVGGHGWTWLGDRVVGIGRFVLDREHSSVSTYTARLTPYSSSPIIMTDSVFPPMSRSRARLEGALGGELGSLGLGVSAAIDTREHNSVDFPLRRAGRASAPVAALGAEYAFPWFGLRTGAYHRWSEPSETNILNPRPEPTVIYSVQGYDEPFGLLVTSNDANPFVRIDRRASATGGTLELTAWDARVIVAHEEGDRADEQTLTPFQQQRAIEHWRASGSETRVLIQRAFRQSFSIAIVGSELRLDGRGSRSDLDGIAFAGRDVQRVAEANVRIRLGRGWRAGIVGGAAEMQHARQDYAAELATDLKARRVFGSLEAGRSFDRGSLVIGVSSTAQIPLDSWMPRIDIRGPNYRRLLAPEMAYVVSEARATALWLGVSARFAGSEFIARLRTERVVPRAAPEEREQPAGDRTRSALEFGIRL